MTTATVLTIRIPVCPDAALSPNWRGHWRERADAVRQLRQAAGYIAKMSMWSQRWETATGSVTVRATIAWGKGRRTMDGDNAAASLKALWDGLTDAGVWIDDKQATFAPVIQTRDPDGRGYVDVEVAA